MTEQRKSFWRRHGWAKWVAAGLLLMLAVAAVVVDLGLRRSCRNVDIELDEELQRGVGHVGSSVPACSATM